MSIGGAREKHEPTDEMRAKIEALAGYGLPQDMIGRCVGLSESTVKKYYTEEMRVGTAKASAQIAQTLFKKAMAGDTASLIFWTKARMNWSEKHIIEHQGVTIQFTPVDEGVL